MTHRQFLAWTVWLDEELSRPSRSDMYAMQTAMEIRRANVKNPKKVKFSDFHIRFKKEAPSKLTREQVAAQSKARWGMALGIDVKNANKVGPAPLIRPLKVAPPPLPPKKPGKSETPSPVVPGLIPVARRKRRR